ncbi:thiolase family protein [Rhodococcus globerulus]|uniref:propanoyl-CoA C-acyltransferase n=1 Tax=Rhodococcus globerulus TaxID=33008 RepID=A0ABU4C3S6_RHOGO|nr:thiolase family protein [Rhodococcus globerulus]MDV6271154.1 thiolase family protein [Rhodococcus globerulus]
MSNTPTWIVGAAMTPFGRHRDRDLIDLGSDAALAALADADVTMQDIEIFAVGNAYESNGMVAQRIQKQIGQTGIEAYNVFNACATGATAVRLAHLAIQAGEVDVALVVGVEKMGKMGMLGAGAKARSDRKVYEPGGRFGAVMGTEGILGTGLMPGVFAQAGMDYARQHDVTFKQFAKVAEKNHRHSTLNPLAQYQKAYDLEEIMSAEMISHPNSVLMCCPTGDGAAALVLMSDKKRQQLDKAIRDRSVKISASVLSTDPYTPTSHAMPDINTLTRRAVDQAYALAGVGPADLDLVELHDCFATAELVHYDNLRLCDEGGAGEFIDSGAPTRDGSTPVNVSGGLISKGHPIGATGVAGLYEVATHLRGEAGKRQIDGARVGLAHVIGLGSACGIHILERSAA